MEGTSSSGESVCFGSSLSEEARGEDESTTDTSLFDRFRSIILVLLVNLLNPGRLVWWAVFLYTVAANAFFLVSRNYTSLPLPSSSLKRTKSSHLPTLLLPYFLPPTCLVTTSSPLSTAPLPKIRRPPRSFLLPRLRLSKHLAYHHPRSTNNKSQVLDLCSRRAGVLDGVARLGLELRIMWVVEETRLGRRRRGREL